VGERERAARSGLVQPALDTTADAVAKVLLKEKRNMKTNLSLRAPVAAFLCALTVVSLVATAVAKESAPPRVNVSDQPIDRTARGASFAPVIKRIAPCVVNVFSTSTVRTQPFELHQFFNDPTFRRFFGDNFDPRERHSQTHKTQGLGSGVIVSEDGYILTNNHVIDGADKDGVEVALADGKEKYPARIVGTDPQTDVAVLKIEAKKLTPITFADSDKLEVGDVVLAIGNPFGVGQSVSMGIISALGRGFGILGAQGYEDFIQTDAPINPGNSGGALVDTEGRLIGINQSIVSGSGANAGVGFAVPINLARTIMDRLVTDGKIARGYLGVNIQSVTPKLAKEFKLPDENGALVGEVRPDTPAANAGLENGDAIVEFNGKKVSDSRHLRLMVAQTPPKTKATLKIIRDGKSKTVTATLGTLPDDLASGPRDEVDEHGETKVDALDGVEVADLDNRTRRQHDIPSEVSGALVTRVDPDSAAAEAELREGDVILEINRQPVRNADDAVRLSEKVKGERLLLRVWSNSGGFGGSRYLTIEPTKKK
jgi:serine protease Do